MRGFETKEGAAIATPQPARRPDWLKARIPSGENYVRLLHLMQSKKLHTVCEEARCPNMGECWAAGTATFLILGGICTRSCGFCAVKTGRPTEHDLDEPRRVAEAVESMGIRHVVITSVDRDDLRDGGSGIFAETIRQIRVRVPTCGVEVLIPDFKGDEEALNTVLDADPDVLNHNVETVPRLYRMARPQAKFSRSLELLARSKRCGFLTKTGLMVGLGEEIPEVIDVMRQLREVDCDVLTIGQYLQPTKQHLPIVRFVTPDEFRMLKEEGLGMGFKHVESGPFVRSSYHAERQVTQTASDTDKVTSTPYTPVQGLFLS